MYNTDVEQYLNSVSNNNILKKRLKTLIPLLSILVIVVVFWWLKLTGITMAGEAFCGYDEHAHNDECTVTEMICTDPDHEHTDECSETTYTCGIEEHIHTSSCYSDISADVERADDWEKSFENIPAELPAADKLIAVAESQLGYAESELNFEVDDNGEKHGYTRYGEWYGNKYGKWPTMFTSFCLNYAGLDNLPVSAGAESMRLEWQEQELYKDPGEYVPCTGDIVFLDKDNDGESDATAITVTVSGAAISVIEGDLENRVAENSYELTDKSIKGYGAIPATAETITEENVIEDAVEEQSVTVGKTVKQNRVAAARAAGSTTIAKATAYNAGQLHLNNRFVLYTQGSNGNYYAIDGNGRAIPIQIDIAGNISTDSTDINSLYWVFEYCGTYDNQRSYYIQNVATGIYLHPFSDSNTNYGAITAGRWESALYVNGTGVKIRGARQSAYAYLQNNSSFTYTNNSNNANVFYFGKAVTTHTIWLDGTNGGLRTAAGSDDTSYVVPVGSTFTLPETWKSPSKYNYRLKGWYDVTNSKYYKPGDTVTITGDAVFYADWVAATYDIGKYNQYVADTISTNEFITTKVYDYNFLFNVMSTNMDSSSISETSHTESWTLLANGNVSYQNSETLNFMFNDYDSSGDISHPKNLNNANKYDSAQDVYFGIYNDNLGEVLFGTDADVIGREYLGKGDHLFQLNDDPSSELYGYYYYDSSLNAASYNQTDQRFYVYDYLERTSDSAGDNSGTAIKYSDILPLNSPYANINGHNVPTYTYNGVNGEYTGTNHCQYDVTGNMTNGNASSNLAFGMSIDVKFYLPNVPGYVDENGNYGNKDIYGKDMHFKFSGDDDVWVLIDGELALDIGGIHGVESGDINFATGDVTVNGQVVGNIRDVAAGEHVLTIHYLERGSSQSNCAMYFNLAPRFELELQKEDVLTQELLDGAEFSVYTDKECTIPAELWKSKASYNNNDPSTNTFRVKDGITSMWGFGAGNTYYLKETRAPDASGYDRARGVIRLTFDKTGLSSHSIEVMDEKVENGNSIDSSNGYAVHGFRINESEQKAYIIVTNAQNWVEETTTVQVMKEWNDNLDHTYDSILAYLTITDPDGTVRRLREITLSEENDWKYIWTGLPKYYEDGVTLVQYGVEEAYKEGYSPTIEKIDTIVVIDYEWSDVTNLQNGTKYYLKTPQGFLSTESASSNKLCWKTEDEVIESPLAEWTATYYGSEVMLQNGAGQVINFNPVSDGSYFSAEKVSGNRYRLGISRAGNDFQFYYQYGVAQYMGPIIEDGKLYEHQRAGATQTFDLKTLIKEEVVETLEDDYSYEITNTPLDEETSLKVNKEWDIGMATDADYERAQVTIKLLANGKDTGRTVTLSLKNNWTDIFRGLPYKDADGSVITYTVEESWENKDWLPVYGEVIIVGGKIPTYETTVTNSYRWGHGYELPATGGPGLKMLLLSGIITMMAALICIFALRRRRERGHG